MAQKSIFGKLTMRLFITVAVIGAVLYVWLPNLQELLLLRFGLEDTTRRYIIPALLLILFLVVVVNLFVEVHRPLHKVFKEMRAMLAGRPYKKIFTKRTDEIGVLAYFFNEVTRNIEHISLDLAEGKRMSKELNVGSEIQQRILPKEIPHIDGLDLFGRTRPASEVGGDSFDIIAKGENNFIYVGDVTGHGVPAGLIMVMVNMLMRTFSEIYQSGYDIIVNTNRVLKQRIEPRRFMTSVMLRWNSKEKKMYYTGAGHEHILLYHAASKKCEVLKSGGIALGMVPDVSKIIKEQALELAPHDMVVLYSDGIIEAKNMNGEMFGLERLTQQVEEYAAKATPEEVFTNISKNFAAFVGDAPQEDDITLIVVQRAEG
ncbi:hypothetical protein COV82_06405 [Candidatus Peregrinibacteria bacterium CG11_big_fil_rev_8_21_14_0_20_46_8]|nr:MAG: hypothetical protein COV82_06405 [Candidatus Peregrinibacteria bacterium CG11_big_fil_rev_8_21_14_0_20_46_8]